MTQPNDDWNDRTQRQQQSEPEVEALYSSICSAFSALPPNLEYLILWVDWEPIYSGFFPDYETMLEWLFAHQLPEERLDKAFPENGRFVEWLIANELIAFSNLLSEEEPQRLLRKRTPRNPGKNHWISSRDREFGSW